MEFPPFDLGRSHLIDVLGYAASGATLCAFAQRQMLPMRISAMAANLFFIGYGAFGLIYPVLLLHLVLLPLNVARLLQQIGQERGARSVQKITLVEEWQRNCQRFSHAAANLMPEQAPRAANSQALRYRAVSQVRAIS